MSLRVEATPIIIRDPIHRKTNSITKTYKTNPRSRRLLQSLRQSVILGDKLWFHRIQRSSKVSNSYFHDSYGKYYYILTARGGVVVNALSYKPAGRGFDPRWCNWNFSVA
jgi:hypothetical protein